VGDQLNPSILLPLCFLWLFGALFFWAFMDFASFCGLVNHHGNYGLITFWTLRVLDSIRFYGLKKSGLIQNVLPPDVSIISLLRFMYHTSLEGLNFNDIIGR
jgi:hypothetical protein